MNLWFRLGWAASDPISSVHQLRNPIRVAKVEQLMPLIDYWEVQIKKSSQLAERFAKAASAALTGIHAAPEETPLKPPITELDAPTRLGKNLKPADQAPLASISARHRGALQAKDLWLRFGGDIAVLYAQLKREFAAGWITEAQPTVMLVREAV